MLCGIFDTTPEDGIVTIEAFNPGRSIGNHDEVT